MISDKPPNVPYPERSEEPLSDYNTAFLASMAFPTLFPKAGGDPFGVYANSSQKTQLAKLQHLLMYGECDSDGSLYSRFAAHPRFVLWAFNITYRHRTLSQGDIYLKQNPGDANLTIDQLKALTENNHKGSHVIDNIRRYMANIPGTPSYWYQVNGKLKAIIESKGPPQVWFTLSFGDR